MALIIWILTIQTTGFPQTNYIAKEKITLLTLEWPPYVGKELPQKGYTYVLVKKVLEKMGYSVEIKFRPWTRIIHKGKKGEIDGFFPAYYVKWREKYFYISDPFYGGPIVFLARKQSKIKYKHIEDLRTYRIGLVKGYINTDKIDNANYLIKDYARNDLINLKKLIKGRVDLIVIDKYVAYYLMKKYLPHCINKVEVLSPIIEYKNLYVCFPKNRKNSLKLLHDFNKGLSILRRNGTLDRLYNEWKQKLIKNLKDIENKNAKGKRCP
ncbi:ABC transporter substrate-binding protein [Desulfothermus okinawensis JCM 13304]